MISITPQIYQDLAKKLQQDLKNKDFFNGTIELDYQELYSTFHCTLIITRSKHKPNKIDDVISVWWEFETAMAYGFEYNDFSWMEFYEYLKEYF